MQQNIWVSRWRTNAHPDVFYPSIKIKLEDIGFFSMGGEIKNLCPFTKNKFTFH